MSPHRLLRELLQPSLLGVFLYILASAAILTASTASSIIDQVTLPENRYYFGQLFHQYTGDALSRLDGVETLGRMTIFLVWASAGAAVYIVVWLLINAYIALHNDVVIGTTYTSINTHGHARYWGELTARGLFRGCAMVLILLIASGVMQVWFPLSITMFKVWSGDFIVPINWVYLLEAFVGWILVFHILTILLRLVLLRTRVFGSDSYA
jgi:hypothetical protein